MTLLQNAIESIQVGVEDYASDDPRRYRSAIRNVTAGLLLLYKQKLRELSPKDDPDTLIRKVLLPSLSSSGQLTYIGKGNTTVNTNEIIERFKQLGVNIDQKKLKNVINLRNEIEHYYTKLSKDNIQEVLSMALVLIRDFLVSELNADPLDELGSECWQTLLKISDIRNQEAELSMASLEKVDWKYETLQDILSYFRCPECHSNLIRTEEVGTYHPQIELICSQCGHSFEAEEILEEAIDEALGGEAFLAAKEGGDPPYDTCPECSRGAFILGEGVCLACESGLQYMECLLCGEALSLDEQDLDGLCSYHHYITEKARYE